MSLHCQAESPQKTPRGRQHPARLPAERRVGGTARAPACPRPARAARRLHYSLNATWRAFVRVENITNTRYQEVLNFGTTGRALYGGFNATW